MQASLSIIACVVGIIAWRQEQRLALACLAHLRLSRPGPTRMLVINPTNDELLADRPHGGRAALRRALIEKWGKLHWGRAAFGISGNAGCSLCGFIVVEAERQPICS